MVIIVLDTICKICKEPKNSEFPCVECIRLKNCKECKRKLRIIREIEERHMTAKPKWKNGVFYIPDDKLVVSAKRWENYKKRLRKKQ